MEVLQTNAAAKLIAHARPVTSSTGRCSAVTCSPHGGGMHCDMSLAGEGIGLWWFVAMADTPAAAHN